VMQEHHVTARRYLLQHFVLGPEGFKHGEQLRVLFVVAVDLRDLLHHLGHLRAMVKVVLDFARHLTGGLEVEAEVVLASKATFRNHFNSVSLSTTEHASEAELDTLRVGLLFLSGAD